MTVEGKGALVRSKVFSWNGELNVAPSISRTVFAPLRLPMDVGVEVMIPFAVPLNVIVSVPLPPLKVSVLLSSASVK